MQNQAPLKPTTQIELAKSELNRPKLETSELLWMLFESLYTLHSPGVHDIDNSCDYSLTAALIYEAFECQIVIHLMLTEVDWILLFMLRWVKLGFWS
jgi:hypothetical protein